MSSLASRPVRIVTVDDQPAFRTAAQAIIASTPGFELVGESADGESALRMVSEADPDIVIVDVRMPGIDGIEVAKRLHGRGSDARRRARLDARSELAGRGSRAGAGLRPWCASTGSRRACSAASGSRTAGARTGVS